MAMSATLDRGSAWKNGDRMSSGIDLNADYEAAGFKRSLEPGERPALLVIDFVNAYLDPDSPLYAGVEDALRSAVRVLAAARKSVVPVIYTKVVYTPGGVDGGIFYRKIPVLEVFDAGSPLGEIPDQAVRKCLLRNLAGFHPDRPGYRHRRDRGSVHQRVRPGFRRGCHAVRLHPDRGSRRGRRS